MILTSSSKLELMLLRALAAAVLGEGIFGSSCFQVQGVGRLEVGEVLELGTWRKSDGWRGLAEKVIGQRFQSNW